MKFAVLGPMEITGPAGPVPVGPARHRQLLACLLQEPNRPVPADRLLERIWGDGATRSSTGTLQGYVSLVRRALGAAERGGGGRLAFAGAGYRLEVAPGELDAERFDRLVDEGIGSLRAGDPGAAWERLGEALGLWRGPAFADAPDDALTVTETSRLDERRLTGLVARADAGLALGRHELVVPELDAACGEHPLHEGLCARRIVALYRSGRPADALAAYRRLHHALAEDHGLEPSARLRALEAAVLTHAPSLDREAVPPDRTPTGLVPSGARPVPPVRFTALGEHEIAYQSWGVGDGPVLVGLPGFAQNIELLWEEPRAERWLRQLGTFCRVVHFDKLGTGLSRRVAPMSTFPQRALELEAVMDAAGVDRAVVGGFSDGGTIAAHFAATRPERVSGLLLVATTPSWVRRDDMPWERSPGEIREFAKAWSASWGTGEVTVSLLAPSMEGDPDYLAWMARYERNSLSPTSVLDLWELDIGLDVRPLLGSITVPTLVLHRRHEAVDLRSARYLAEHIPGARLSVLPGSDHLPWIGDTDQMLAQMREFLTTTRC